MAVWATIAVCLCAVFVGTKAIECQVSSFRQQHNQISMDPVRTKTCPQACQSLYFNDGWSIRYELGCADPDSCPETEGCTVTKEKTRICCCFTDNCVHVEASEPVNFSLPPDFSFATATAAYQIEGGAAEDGKGPSVWDIFTHKSRKIRNGDTGDIACDSYHRWREDVAMLRQLNVSEYRFSISWPRVLPLGTIDNVNAAGVKYYHDLLDALIDAEIKAMVTIFHWDLPQALQDKGGFLNEAVVDWFGDYARFIFATFGSKIDRYITINEPLSIVKYGYCGEAVVHAPGEFKSHCDWAVYQAAHNLLLCHARAVQIFRQEFSDKLIAGIGIALSGVWYFPETASQADTEAAERGFQFAWGWWAHPIFGPDGDYPQVMRDRIHNASTHAQRRLTSRLPAFTPHQKKLLKGSADFLGVNYYRSSTARARTETEYNWMDGFRLAMDAGIVAGTRAEWETVQWISMVPEGLRLLLNKFNQEFPGISILITENGVMNSAGDVVELKDHTRIRYLRSHLAAVSQAIEDGVHVIGYTLWSLMDNFEWTSGYSDRFGLFSVNFTHPHRPRTPKASAEFYRLVSTTQSVVGFSLTNND